MGLGTMEIVLIALVVVLLFGAKKIPELAKGLGSGIRMFKEGMKDGQEEKKEENVKIATKEAEPELKTESKVEEKNKNS